MSRSSTSGSRGLTLTEELEKLEQSITLTLQEIDHNFSKAHRIVTSSILPKVEQYGQHSREVWEGSKFWKQFFEASANVSLSGYEEAALDEDVTHTGTMSTHDTTFETPESQRHGDVNVQGEDEDVTPIAADEEEEEDRSLLDSPSNATGIHGTPQLSVSRSKTQAHTPVPSPTPPRASAHRIPYRKPRAPAQPSTPQGNESIQHSESSPFEPPSAYQLGTAQRQQQTNPDPLLHRVLDKNYRVQATPHTARRTQTAHTTTKATPQTTSKDSRAATLLNSSPLDSSPIAVPELRSDLFSPMPAQRSPARGLKDAGRSLQPGPRTPGVPLNQTPGTAARLTSTGRPISYAQASSQYKSPATQDAAGDTRSKSVARTPALWDSDSDSDDGLDATGAFRGMSPPKTMQFVLPGSRLLQTPAREASKRIVEDLLLTAGAEDTDEIEGYGEEAGGAFEEESPSVVRRRWDEDDDTF